MGKLASLHKPVIQHEYLGVEEYQHSQKGTLQFINASDARAEKPQEGNFGEPFM